MRRVKISITELAYKAGGGFLGCFGLPFFAAGIATMFGPILGGMTTKGGQPVGLAAGIFVFLFGLIFASVGAAFLFGRTGITFDKAAKTVTRWYGLLFPMWTKVEQLEQYAAVQITQETRKSSSKSSTTYTVYPVRLATSGDDTYDISEPREEMEARKLAEEIAKFLDLDILDSTSGAPVRRERGTLDESLRDRLQRTGEAADISAPPPGMRSQYSAEGNTIVFEIPPPPLNPVLILPVIGAIAFSSIAGYMFLGPLLSDPKAPAQMKWIFGGFFGLFFVLVPVGATLGALIAGVTRRARIEADAGSLRVTRKGLLFSRTMTIPGEELEELRLETTAKRQLAAMSDRRTERFGEGLSEPELEWMRAVILKAIAA